MHAREPNTEHRHVAQRWADDLGEGEGIVLGEVDGEDGGGEEGGEEEGEEVGGLEEEGRPDGGEAVPGGEVMSAVSLESMEVKREW
jgi:hypothetical protein